MKIGTLDDTPGVQDLFEKLNGQTRIDIDQAKQEVRDLLEPLTESFYIDDEESGFSVSYNYKIGNETFRGSITYPPRDTFCMPQVLREAPTVYGGT